jgi:hypothetical protein
MLSFAQFLIELKDIDTAILDDPTLGRIHKSPWMGQKGKKEAERESIGLQAFDNLHGFLSDHLSQVHKAAGYSGEQAEILGAKASHNLLKGFGDYDTLRKYMIRNTGINPVLINNDFHEAAMHHVGFNLWVQENSDLVDRHLKNGGHITELISKFMPPSQTSTSLGGSEPTGDVDENGNIIP